MASNPYVNKVEYDGQTIIDLTNDTITPSDVINGTSFHDRSGTPQQGSLITHNVYDGLDSESSSDALSAKQGNILFALINSYNLTKDVAVSDANAELDNGAYIVTSNTENVPYKVGTLFNIDASTGQSDVQKRRMQFLIATTHLCYRSFAGETWYAWREVTSTAV